MKKVLGLFLGIVLIMAGTAMLTYQGITVTTAARQLLHVGPVQAATEQANWTITLPPILGALLLAVGTAVVFVFALFRKGVKPRAGAHESERDTQLTRRSFNDFPEPSALTSRSTKEPVPHPAAPVH